jgi:hypothetical protein
MRSSWGTRWPAWIRFGIARGSLRPPQRPLDLTDADGSSCVRTCCLMCSQDGARHAASKRSTARSESGSVLPHLPVRMSEIGCAGQETNSHHCRQTVTTRPSPVSTTRTEPPPRTSQSMGAREGGTRDTPAPRRRSPTGYEQSRPQSPDVVALVSWARICSFLHAQPG